MNAITYARENKVPFLGLSLGMQLAAVEFARNVLGLRDAHSVEIEPLTMYPVIDVPATVQDESGMRLGNHRCVLMPGSLSHKAYGTLAIEERHRHKAEFNNAYKEKFSAGGMRIAGKNEECDLVEIIELVEHPFFVGVQFHPEFKSRPNRPHPLMRDFVGAALAFADKAK